MRKTKTDVQRAKDAIKNVNEQVMLYTGIAPEKLSELSFNTALEWIDGFVGNNKEAQFQLSQQGMFWGFWQNAWTTLQDAFIDRIHLDEDNVWYLYINGAIYDKALIAREYYSFMHYFMLQNKGNSAVLELAFHKRLKQEVTK